MSDLRINIDFASNSPDQVSTATETPTTLLRWNEGVLEQSIELKQWNSNGTLTNWINFWRPVPTLNASPLGEQSE